MMGLKSAIAAVVLSAGMACAGPHGGVVCTYGGFLGSEQFTLAPGSYYEGLTIDGDAAYTRYGTQHDGRGLGVFALDGEGSAPLLGSIPADDLDCFFVKDGLAYLGRDGDRLEIHDVSDPASITLIGSLTLGEGVQSMHRVGDLLFALTGHLSSEVRILDVSEPSQPVQVGGVDPGGAYVIWDTLAFEGLLITVGTDRRTRLYDTSDPALPKEIGTIDTPTIGFSYRLASDGQLLCITSPSEIVIVNITDPTSPLVRSQVSMQTLFGDFKFNDLIETRLEGDRLCLLFESGGLFVLDIADPGSPVLAGQIDTYEYATGFDITQGVAKLLGVAGSVMAVELDGLNPLSARRGSYAAYEPYGVQVQGDRAYVIEDEGTLRILDVSDPDHPVPLGGTTFDSQDILNIEVLGSYAYVATEVDGLQILDISDPLNIVTMPALSMLGKVWRVMIDGDSMALMVGNAILLLFDRADPTHPVLMGLAQVNSYNIIPETLVLRDRCVYMSVYDRDEPMLLKVDMSEPLSPVVTSVPTSQDFRAMTIEGGLIYGVFEDSSFDTSGLAIYDPADLHEVRVEPLPVWPLSLTVVGNRAYIGDFGPQVLVYGLTEHAVIGSIELEEEACGIAVSGSLAYIVQDRGDTGFQVLDVSEGCPGACPADLTGDGVLNFFDVSAFLSAFGAGDPIADFTSDGSLNFFDVSVFLQNFGQGCP